MKESQSKREELILQFINKAKELFGDIPKFIHTTDNNGANYSGPTFDDDEIMEILDSVLFGGWLASGDKVHKFEEEFSKKFNQKHSVMVNSGSSANLLMIASLKKYLKWNDGDEIILSVVGFPTTLSAITANGLKPIFVDIEMETLNFDLNEVYSKITDKTKAIFISPVLGNSPDMDSLNFLSITNGISLILDNCDSLGSKWRGRFLSDYCTASSNSFYPSHHITTGEGGMICSNNKPIIDIARSMSAWGRACSCVGEDNLNPNGKCGKRFNSWLPDKDIIVDHKYVFTNMGYNLKPLDLQGGIGLAQLKKFDYIDEVRVLNKHLIDELITKHLTAVKTISETEYAYTCWFGVPMICPDYEYKQRLQKHLEANKVQTRNYFAGNILLHEAYSHLDNWKDYPNANLVLKRVLFIGCSPNYTIGTINHIEKVFKSFKP